MITLHSAEIRARDPHRARLADDLAAFQSAGGEVQRLGNTPIKGKTITLRETMSDLVSDKGDAAGLQKRSAKHKPSK
ncbi:hypothetical protein NB688_000553 [Xanthomonas sacchari]|uniref:Uncharacterized protein n=1 Tax=Xanthomonas sacchari TaxID=56458 RepID=A0ABT3DTB6_9XANT|nr:hypothetical protein [Xanthomonas sacchari]MCW0398739.1 hypothetical protein [Xanthomonas sacchari]MCW0418387.1 hypothetical protein [Xanthomonas sacchari]UYK72552.1 hypothetical protein NG828_20585 [Xanthomonas sacchari]